MELTKIPRDLFTKMSNRFLRNRVRSKTRLLILDVVLDLDILVRINWQSSLQKNVLLKNIVIQSTQCEINLRETT